MSPLATVFSIRFLICDVGLGRQHLVGHRRLHAGQDAAAASHGSGVFAIASDKPQIMLRQAMTSPMFASHAAERARAGDSPSP